MMEWFNWAMNLEGVGPVARLLAIYMAERGKPYGMSKSEKHQLLEIYRQRACDWIGCSNSEIPDAVRDLVDRGLRGADVGQAVVKYRMPLTLLKVEGPKSDLPLYIYVLSISGACKIGVSGDVTKRARNLQSANPKEKLEIAFELRGPGGIIRRAERAAHYKLAEHAIQNEWFKVSAEIAIATIRAVMEEIRAGE